MRLRSTRSALPPPGPAVLPAAINGRRLRSGADGWILMAIVAGGIASCLATYGLHGYEFPVGADAPVYIWWIRLAGQEGLSAVGDRPGVPALALGLGAVVPGGAAALVAALEIALAMILALVASAWVRAAGYRRTAWMGSGALTGAFALHLAVGYVATLLAAVLVVTAIAVLSRSTRRGVVGAAGLLGVAGFAHPEFLLIGTAVLGLTAMVSPRGERGRIAIAMAGGLAIAGAGMALVSIGPSPIDIDTSRDDVVQRLGFTWMLPALFRQRLIDHAPVLVPLLTVPLGALGLFRSRGFLGRILTSWFVVTLVAGGVAFATGVVPPERFVTFCFALPIAVGIGVDAVASRVGGGAFGGRGTRAMLGHATALALLGAVALGGLIVWFATPPKLFPTEVARVTEASRYAGASPPGTPLVFSVSSGAPKQSSFTPEAGNAIRSAVPPDRIRDVRVVITPPLALDIESAGDQVDRALVAFLRVEAFDSELQPLWFDLAPFDRRAFSVSDPDSSPVYVPVAVSQGVAIAGPHPTPVSGPIEPLQAASPLTIAGATIAVFAALMIVGWGWSMWLSGVKDTMSVALAPALGAAAVIAGSMVADLLGIPMGSRWTAWLPVAIFAAGFAARRRSLSRGDPVHAPKHPVGRNVNLSRQTAWVENRSTRSDDMTEQSQQELSDDQLPSTEEEWRQRLTSEQFEVLRNKGTERAFTGEYAMTKDGGVYRCAGCGAELFSSDTKFDSGTGWPSFWEPIESDAVELHHDKTLFMRRTEVTCARCGGHLGHVFDDGPHPTGQRYCMNSVSLKHEPTSDEG